MKAAKVRDHLGKVWKRNYINKVDKLNYRDIGSVGDGNLVLTGGITAFCGANGAGKTSLLLALLGVLRPEYLKRSPVYARRLVGAELDATLRTKSGAQTRRINFKTGDIDPKQLDLEVVWIDFSSQSPELLKLFSKEAHLEEWLETVEPHDANNEELELLNYVVGKEYKACLTYELDSSRNSSYTPIPEPEDDELLFDDDEFADDEFDAEDDEVPYINEDDTDVDWDDDEIDDDDDLFVLDEDEDEYEHQISLDHQEQQLGHDDAPEPLVDPVEYSDPIVPYFRVKSAGIQYGTETMGLGELSVHYILWHLRNAKPNSIVLIEEPETYLAPRSQEALVNVLAKFCDEKGLWVVLTTHSPAILNSIPPNHVRYFSRVKGSVRVQVPRSQTRYFSDLGMRRPQSGVILVEDRAAREFARVWIEHHGSHVLQQFEVKDVDRREKKGQKVEGGDGGINAIIAALRFPKVGEWLKIIGLFDGDTSPVTSDELNWPISYLPGEDPPEKVLMSAIDGDPVELAELLSLDLDDVHAALGIVEGLDHHDWFITLHKELNVSYERLMTALFSMWVRMPGNASMSQNAFNTLLETIRGSA